MYRFDLRPVNRPHSLCRDGIGKFGSAVRAVWRNSQLVAPAARRAPRTASKERPQTLTDQSLASSGAVGRPPGQSSGIRAGTDPAAHTIGTRRAATAAGEMTSMSIGTRQRSVRRTFGSVLLAGAPSMTKPSKPPLITSLHFCT